MIYVASSWRNRYQPEIVNLLREQGYVTYDFRHPAMDNDGFHWSAISPYWKSWNAWKYRAALTHDIAQRGFEYDMNALKKCEICVLVMPCGRSAHLELGWAVGAGKKTIYYIPPGMMEEPDLMVKMVDHLCVTEEELLTALKIVQPIER